MITNDDMAQMARDAAALARAFDGLARAVESGDKWQMMNSLSAPSIHPSRVGDPPAQGCEAAPNRKPKPWESVRWQPRKKE